MQISLKHYTFIYFTAFFLLGFLSISFIFPAILTCQDDTTTSNQPSTETKDQNQDLLQELDGILDTNKEKKKTDMLNELDDMLNPDQKSESTDLLNELDESQETESDKSFFSSLGKNFGGKLGLHGYHFWSEFDASDFGEADTRQDFITAIMDYSTWAGSDAWRFDLSGWLEAGNAGYNWAGVSQFPQDKEERSRYVEMNELYLRWYFDSFDLTVGKKILPNGIAPFFSPADRYTPRDFHDPLFTKKLGIWQIRTDYYWDDVSITGAILPIFQTSKNPDKSSRWMLRSLDFDFTGISSDNENISMYKEIPNIDDDNIGFFLRGKTAIQGWDVFASAYYGLNPLFVLSIDNLKFTELGDPIGPFAPQILDSLDFVKKHSKVFHFASGFSTVVDKFEIHSEGLLNYSSSGKDDTYLQYISGLTYKIDDWAKYLHLLRIDLAVDYMGTWMLERQSADGYLRSFGDYRYGKNELIALIRLQVKPDLWFYASTIYPIGQEDWFLQFGGQYQLRENLTARLSFDQFHGPVDSDYGRWEDCNRIVLSVEYTF